MLNKVETRPTCLCHCGQIPVGNDKYIIGHEDKIEMSAQPKEEINTVPASFYR